MNATDGMERPRALLAASTGGHLLQLTRIAPTLGVTEDSRWITFDSPQSRSLLQGKDVRFVPYIAPRDIRGVAASLRPIADAMRGERFDIAISTGAGIALAVLPIARLFRVSSLYIESVSRVNGPSLTGRIVSKAHLADTWTQHRSWETKRWRYNMSVLDSYRSEQVRPEPYRPSAFVTLGTIQPYRFDSLVNSLVKKELVDDRTVWQVGCTSVRNLPGTVVTQMEHQTLLQTARSADCVITHAGVGTILDLLDIGVHPVVVPRSSARNEHIDDHQEQIAELLRSRGLATVESPENLTMDHLRRAAGHSVSLTAGSE